MSDFMPCQTKWRLMSRLLAGHQDGRGHGRPQRRVGRRKLGRKVLPFLWRHRTGGRARQWCICASLGKLYFFE
ncbi:TY3B-G protein [Caligus rogercresseyi]|uniref:TY3B-G protein n=1 Tax=Caligus rogercresseyi TaxID=217165 RepID=A0A7T8KFB6_CALRO|nr:TY3B-G protein [Caligus rogercresseyi]